MESFSILERSLNNGPHKGGSPAVTAILRRLPDIQGIYQMHKNLDVAAQENADADSR